MFFSRNLFWNFFLFFWADVQCPLVIDHGRIPTTCRRLAGDVCEFTCNEGYQLGVPETTILLCGSNGKWNQTSELCKGRVIHENQRISVQVLWGTAVFVMIVHHWLLYLTNIELQISSYWYSINFNTYIHFNTCRVFYINLNFILIQWLDIQCLH